MARLILPLLSLFGLVLSGAVPGPACPPDFPQVLVTATEEVTVYPVYVSTYCTAKTTLTINSDFTITVTNAPTQVITSRMCTTTSTRTIERTSVM